MSTAPASMPTPERIFQALGAHQLSSALAAAIRLDLFTAIDDGHTDASSIAARCGASEKGCRVLCDFLTSHQILTKTNGSWGLTPETQFFLSRKSRAYLGDIVGFLHTPKLLEHFEGLEGAIRKGGTVQPEESVSPENPIWVDFARSMAPMMMGAAIEIAEFLGDGGGESWEELDIAAGHGLFGIQIAAMNPNARITALDWKPVLAVAQQNAERFGVADRFRQLPGDAFETGFGGPYDVALLTNFLHHFDVPTCVGLLKKLHASLRPGARVVTLEFVPDEDRVSPATNATFALTMLATTKHGDAYTFSELRSMFEEAGFVASEMRELQRSPQRIIISTK